MATIFQQLANTLGLTSSQPTASSISQISGNQAAFQLDLHTAPTSGERLFITPATGGTVNLAGDSHRNVVIGAQGNDNVTGGDGPDLIFGGAGVNVLAGGGGTDVFGHTAGASDFIVDFAPEAGEKIALAAGLNLAGSATVSVNPAALGLTGTAAVPATELQMNDGSTVTLVHVTTTPSSDWFV
jgi:Ca2+-binding RTX toxin-like protein